MEQLELPLSLVGMKIGTTTLKNYLVTLENSEHMYILHTTANFSCIPLHTFIKNDVNIHSTICNS